MVSRSGSVTREMLKHTERDIMVDIERHMLPNLDLVYAFQDRQPVTHAIDSHLLQLIVLQRDKSFTYDPVF
jgi:hypothetical protein